MGVLLSRIDCEAALRLVGEAGSGAAYDETVSTTAAVSRLKG